MAKGEQSKVTWEQFVDIWNRAATLEEVLAKTGFTASNAKQRALKMRKLDVPMKRFSAARGKLTPIEVIHLRAIARKAQDDATIAPAPSAGRSSTPTGIRPGLRK